MEKAQRIKPVSYLEILVYEALAQHDYPSDRQDLNNTVMEIEQEINQIIQSLNDEENLEAYVMARQRQLVRLIDLLSLYSIKQDVYKNIFKSLGELLNYLERNYACYLDENCKVPFPYLLMTQEFIVTEMENIDKILAADDIDPALKQLVLKPYHDLLAVEDNDFLYSYWEIVYLIRLQMELCTTIKTDDELVGLLLYYNFNDPAFFKYLIEKTRTKITDALTRDTKKQILLELQRSADHTPDNPGMYFRKLQPSLKHQLLCWVSTELSWQDSLAIRYNRPGEMSVWDDYKVITGFSAEQLGRFFGLLQEKGLITNANKKQFALFISTFFTTSQRDDVSPEHMRRSFYNKNDRLANSLRDILIELINISRKP